jgi:hypothetical protein
MSFTRPIRLENRYGLEVVWVEVPLEFNGSRGAVEQTFIFDTGCQLTTVSQDVALRLGLPPGGRAVNMRGLTGGGTGRLVDVRFRFPQTVSGTPGLEVSSTWVVLPGVTRRALLGFMEVHRHFQIRALEFDLYFIPWTSARGR